MKTLEPSSAHRRRAVTPADELGLLIDGATNYAIYMLDPEGRITIWTGRARAAGPKRTAGDCAATGPSSSPT